MEALRQDIIQSCRRLRRTPGFTAVAAVTIALGVAATTTVFSVANGLLLKAPDGVSDPGSLVNLHTTSPDGSSFHAFSYPEYREYREGDIGLAGLATYSVTAMSLLRTDEPELVAGMLVSDNYFDVVGARPALGRAFAADDQDVAVLSYDVWRDRFAGDSAVLGRTVTVNRHPLAVIGVAEPGFRGHIAVLDAGIWVPVAAQPLLLPGERLGWDSSWLEVVGRVRPGVSREQVQASADLVARRIMEARPEVGEGHGIDVRRYTALFGQFYGSVFAFMALLLGIAGVVLLIACMNVANLLLARGTGRAKEIAVRLALGSGRRRVLQHLVVESVLLFALGGLAGTVLAFWAARALSAFHPPIPIPIALDFAPDVRVLGFALAAAFLTGVTFGLVPALRASRPALVPVLKSETAGGGSTHTRLRDLFVVTQVAGSALLLVGAGLFVRSLGRAAAIDPGLDPSGVEIATIDLGINNYGEAEGRDFYRRLEERLAASPGVEVTGLVQTLPLNLENSETVITIEGHEVSDDHPGHQTDFNVVTPGYFPTMRISILGGRGFDATDVEGAPLVAILNETAARTYWPGESAVGKRIFLGRPPDAAAATVVGIARDGKYRSLGEDARVMLYIPFAQDYRPQMTLAVRGDGNTGAAVRSVLRELDPALPYLHRGPMGEVMAISLLPQRLAAGVASGFGSLGLLLAAVGLYGILAYTVALRTREFGIRLALGATGGRLIGLVLRRGLVLTAIGLGVGFGAAWGVTRLIGGLLFGLNPLDPVTYGGIGVALMVVTLLASYMPARRARGVDPMVALREQ